MSFSDLPALQDDLGRDTVLCAFADIADPGGRGFRVRGRDPMFVIRRGGAVFGYRNVCPHQGTTLDWNPHSFLTVDRTALICATHGAMFRIEDGFCVAGPCRGCALGRVAVRVETGLVMLDE